MARNVRNITVKGFTIKYAVAKNGELAQGEFVTGISNPRKQVKAIAEKESVAPESVIIITTTSADTGKAWAWPRRSARTSAICS